MPPRRPSTTDSSLSSLVDRTRCAIDREQAASTSGLRYHFGGLGNIEDLRRIQKLWDCGPSVFSMSERRATAALPLGQSAQRLSICIQVEWVACEAAFCTSV